MSKESNLVRQVIGLRKGKSDLEKTLKGMAVTKRMVLAAQSSYQKDPEYGLSDDDMKKAIEAAMRAAIK
jgi:hypothetical protein